METIKKIWAELSAESRTFFTGVGVGGSLVVLLVFLAWALF